MNRVTVTRPMIGICHMQVCAAADATDEEILAVCNRENPSGTQHGWTTVVREGYPEGDVFRPEPPATSLPVPCSDNPNRLHFLVAC